MKRVPLLIAAALAWLVTLGCQQPAPFRDDLPAQRLVSLLPNATQIVVALGAGDRLVGCTAFGPREGVNPEAVALGGALDTNFEKILALAPDLVLVQATMDAHINRLRALGLRVLPLPVETVADAQTCVREIAKALGKTQDGLVVANRLQTELDILRRRVAARPRVRTLLVVGHDPGQLRNVIVAAPGTFLDELLTIAGGVNVVGDTPALYPQFNKEALLAANPDVIVVFQPRRDPPPDLVKNETALWRAWPVLDAAKNNRVHVISDYFALSPGTDLGKTARALADVLYPKSEDQP